MWAETGAGDLAHERVDYRLELSRVWQAVNFEIKRRTDVLDSLPGDNDIVRLVHAPLLEKDYGSGARGARFMTLGSIAPMCENVRFRYRAWRASTIELLADLWTDFQVV
jgi:hypothetical protein